MPRPLSVDGEIRCGYVVDRPVLLGQPATDALVDLAGRIGCRCLTGFSQPSLECIASERGRKLPLARLALVVHGYRGQRIEEVGTVPGETIADAPARRCLAVGLLDETFDPTSHNSQYMLRSERLHWLD
jgi:hypothetical protein